MTQQELETKLSSSLQNLEKLEKKIIKTQGYVQDAKKIRLLKALIKEQIRSENLMSTIGKTRR